MNRSGKIDCLPTSQEVAVMKEHTNPRLSNAVSTKETTVTSCTKTKSEEEIVQATATDGVGKVKLKIADTLAPELHLEVPPTKVTFFAKPTYKVRIGVGVTSQRCTSQHA